MIRVVHRGSGSQIRIRILTQFHKRLEYFSLHAIHSLSYWRIFKILTKKYAKQENSSQFMKHFVERINEGSKPDKNSCLKDLSLCPENLDEKCCLRIPSLETIFARGRKIHHFLINSMLNCNL